MHEAGGSLCGTGYHGRIWSKVGLDDVKFRQKIPNIAPPSVVFKDKIKSRSIRFIISCFHHLSLMSQGRDFLKMGDFRACLHAD